MNILANTNKTSCNGCSACSNVCPVDAIRFIPDEIGFLYPSIDSNICIKCKKCEAICSETQIANLKEPLQVYAAANKNRNALYNSSSGGIFSVLAEHILQNNGIVCGCVFDSSLNPIHICTEKREEFLLMQKSKYAQSDIKFVYREIKEYLKKGKTVLFTGTPCQVSALYSIVGRNHENLVTMDLICHGVPSNAMFHKFLSYLEKKYKTKIINFDFRSKKYGWPRFTMEFTNNSGKIKNIGKYDEFYIPAFTSGNMMRPSCFDCTYATPKRIGDITIGDFWGHEKVDLPFDISRGLSVFTLNSKTALNFLPVFQESLHTMAIDYQIAVTHNTCLNRPTSKGNKWDFYMTAFKNDNIESAAKQYIETHKNRILQFRIKNLIPKEIFIKLKKMRTKK